MTTDARLADALARLPDYLGSHVLVSITAAPGAARRPARGGERVPDHSRARAAGAVLPEAARARRPVRAAVRQRLLRPRLSSIGAGADALFDAAGAAQYRGWT